MDSPFPNERWTYDYDEAGQLTTATNGAAAARGQTLAYDGIGNITANARVGDYSYDPAHPHAVTTAGANTYAYDGACLMTSGAGREITASGGSLATDPRGFTGRRQDASGLVYLNARYYDPVLNRYAYAANDPVNHTDKSGLDCHDDSGAPCDQDGVELEFDYNDQDSGDYCGPVSVRNALSALGYDIDNVYTENALASMTDIVDLAQTPTAEYTTRMLNQATGSSFYETKWIPGSTATDVEKSRLRADVVHDIVERNHPIVANIVGNDISDDENSAHTYSGEHCIAVVGATRGGDYVKTADSASAEETHWMRTDSLADWIGTRAYSA